MKPTKYDESYCKKLVLYMAKGHSYESFGAVLDVGRTTLYDWEKKHPEWKEAKLTGMAKAQEFFESRLLAKVSGSTKQQEGFDLKLVDTSCLIFALKTRFHKIYGVNKGDKTDAPPDATPKIIINMGDDNGTK